MDMEQKHRDEMNKLNESNSDLQRQVKDKANLDIVFELLREGKTKQAFRMMAVLDVNPENYKILAERLADEETLEAFSGNPDAQKWIRAAKNLPPEQAQAFIFQHFIQPGIENEQTPDIDVPQQQQKTQPAMLPPGVEDDRQGSLDTFFGQLPTSQRSITDVVSGGAGDTQVVDPLTYNNQGNQGWNATKLSDFDAFMGRDSQPGLQARAARERGIITPKEERTATRRQLGLESEQEETEDNRFIQFAMDNNKSYDEAVNLLQSLKQRTTSARGLTGDAALFEQLRLAFPNATLEELRSFFQSASNKGGVDQTAKSKDWQEIEKGLLAQGKKKYSPEWTQAWTQHWGLAQDPKEMGLAQRITQDPKLLNTDKDALLSLMQLPRSVNTPDSLEGAYIQVGRIRQEQGALFGNIETYLQDPEAAIKKAADEAKAQGRLDTFLDTILPDRDKGLGMLITNKLFPTKYDREILDVVRRNVNVQSIGIGSQKLADAEKMARDMFSLLSYFKHAITNKKIYNAQVPYAVRTKLTGLFALLGKSPVTAGEIESAVQVGKAFSLFMNFISGAAVSEEEAARLAKTFIQPTDSKEMSLAKIDAMYASARDELTNHYTVATDRETAKRISELIIDESYDAENRAYGTIDSWLRGLGDRNIENMTYGQIWSALTKQAETFMEPGKEFTKTQLESARAALKGIRDQKLMRAGNPSSMFTPTFSTKQRELLQGWVADADNPIEVFESITNWVPVDLNKTAASVQLALQQNLDRLEKRYLDALKKTGKFTEKLKKELATAKDTMKVIRQLEINAFQEETATDFIEYLRNNKPKMLESFTEDELRILWLDIHKRGF